MLWQSAWDRAETKTRRSLHVEEATEVSSMKLSLCVVLRTTAFSTSIKMRGSGNIKGRRTKRPLRCENGERGRRIRPRAVVDEEIGGKEVGKTETTRGGWAKGRGRTARKRRRTESRTRRWLQPFRGRLTHQELLMQEFYSRLKIEQKQRLVPANFFLESDNGLQEKMTFRACTFVLGRG